VPDNLQSSKPLFKLGNTLWMCNYYNSLSLCSLLRDNWNNVTGILLLNRKHVPQLVKSKKLAKGKSVASECNGIVAMTRKDKTEVVFISTFHDNDNSQII
jgi:hypothetical protein